MQQSSTGGQRQQAKYGAYHKTIGRRRLLKADTMMVPWFIKFGRICILWPTTLTLCRRFCISRCAHTLAIYYYFYNILLRSCKGSGSFPVHKVGPAPLFINFVTQVSHQMPSSRASAEKPSRLSKVNLKCLRSGGATISSRLARSL